MAVLPLLPVWGLLRLVNVVPTIPNELTGRSPPCPLTDDLLSTLVSYLLMVWRRISVRPGVVRRHHHLSLATKVLRIIKVVDLFPFIDPMNVYKAFSPMSMVVFVLHLLK